MLLSQAISKYVYWHRAQYHTDDTIRNYTDFLGFFLEFCGDVDINTISLESVQSYSIYLIDKGLSKSTVATYLRHVKSFFGYLTKYNLILDTSLHGNIKLPKNANRSLKIYTSDEIQRIFDNILPVSGWIHDRNKLIIALMLDSGLRQREVTLIENKDFHGDILLVHGKGDKTRFVPVGNLTAAFIKTYRSCCPYNSDYLLVNVRGNNLSGSAIKQFVYDMQKQLGFELCSHKLRHNFATNYILDQYNEHGSCDIYRLMYLLGHEDIETTKIYLHIANQFLATTSSISHLDQIF